MEKVKFRNYVRIFVFILISLFILDSMLTGFAVHKLIIAEEYNLINKFIWNLFGYPIGESIRFFIGIFFIYLLYTQCVSNNIKKSIFAFCILLFVMALYLVAEFHNLSILINYLKT
jgi:hypothetical protein